MLNVLADGPYRYIHCAATGQLILTLQKTNAGFYNLDHWTKPHPLRWWKRLARQRIGDRLITDDAR